MEVKSVLHLLLVTDDEKLQIKECEEKTDNRRLLYKQIFPIIHRLESINKAQKDHA